MKTQLTLCAAQRASANNAELDAREGAECAGATVAAEADPTLAAHSKEEESERSRTCMSAAYLSTRC